MSIDRDKKVNSIHCYNCGSEILKSHKFCYSCGIELNWSFINNNKSDKPLNLPITSIKKSIDIADLFNKVESTLKKESMLSEIEFEQHWGKFKNYHYKNYDDNDIYQIFVGVVFFAGFKAGIVSLKLPKIKEYFKDYNTVKNYTQNDVDSILKDTGIIKNKKKIQACINIAKQFADTIKEHGSFINYLENFGSLKDNIVLEAVRASLMKFDYIGPVTSYHVMLDLGLNVWKPDIVICRILERLGLLSDRNNKEEAVQIGKNFAKQIGLPIRYIDIVMVKYGQKGPEEPFRLEDGICLEKNPRCGVCGIVEYCIYDSKNL